MSFVSGTMYGMPASRIFRLARTSRCAMVAGGHQKRSRNLVRLQAAQGAQRQRHLRLRSERGVAAGEDQAKTVVGNLARVVIRFLDLAHHAAGGVHLQLFLRPRSMPHAVDGLVPRRLDDPRAREFGHSGRPPLVHSGRKGLLRRLFRQVEIADQPDQCGDNPAPIGAIDSFNRRGGFRRHT